MPLKIEVQNKAGFADLLAKLDQATSESAIRKAAASAASVVLKEAEARAPVGPRAHHQGAKKFPIGFGKENMFVAFNSEMSVEGKIATYLCGWDKDAFYLRFYEYGTSKQRARPFFRPAIDATKQAQADAINASLAQSLKDAGL
ncbi:hypothetical protein G3N59_05415 [Paraburkholderia sp. Ac-20340]|uniref:HK97-gp10 family putative phage morphogenesis protein n=1 Tax=Paraburkholderia sp. Ac-20340 TaxID=2703888 RepID=UPI0019821DCA|nr:HK97-gp10 family putative phage morphogenesis protein [Paraburkholderia sp. Ac-20340]MBN3852814.1 hypothetical protein [Paraburkholderia sp. Ac-20340]